MYCDISNSKREKKEGVLYVTAILVTMEMANIPYSVTHQIWKWTTLVD